MQLSEKAAKAPMSGDPGYRMLRSILQMQHGIHYMSLRMETVLRLADNRKLFHLHKATITWGSD